MTTIVQSDKKPFHQVALSNRTDELRATKCPELYLFEFYIIDVLRY